MTAIAKFTAPGRRAYPLAQPTRQRQMLDRLAEHGTPESRKKLRDAVAARYPGLKQARKQDD